MSNGHRRIRSWDYGTTDIAGENAKRVFMIQNFENTEKHSTSTLQLMMGPFQSKVLTYYKCFWGTLSKHGTYTLKLLLEACNTFLYYMLLFLSTPGMGWQFGFTWYGKTLVFARPRPVIWSPLCSHVELPKIVSNFVAHHYWLRYISFAQLALAIQYIVNGVRPLSAIHLHINSTDILKHYWVTLSSSTHSCCIKCHSRDHCGASNTLNHSMVFIIWQPFFVRKSTD